MTPTRTTMYSIEQNGRSVCLAETLNDARGLARTLNDEKSPDSDPYTVGELHVYHGVYHVYHDLTAEYDATDDTMDILRESVRTPDSKHDFTVRTKPNSVMRTHRRDANGHDIYSYDIRGTDGDSMRTTLYDDVKNIREERDI